MSNGNQAAQQWDAVAEFKQRWPKAGLSDEQILTSLQDPTKFRSAFPNYTGVTDDEIRAKMSAYRKVPQPFRVTQTKPSVSSNLLGIPGMALASVLVDPDQRRFLGKEIAAIPHGMWQGAKALPQAAHDVFYRLRGGKDVTPTEQFAIGLVQQGKEFKKGPLGYMATIQPESIGNLAGQALITEGTAKGMKAVGRIRSGAPPLEDVLHAGGLGLREHIAGAVKNVDAEVSSAAQRIVQHDAQVAPQGSIVAQPIRDQIQVALDDYVKTPEKYPEPLARAFKDYLTTDAQKPGNWTWDQAKQIRSAIGQAGAKASGPMRGALTGAYARLSEALETKASEYGLKAEWSHYNRLFERHQRSLEGHLGDVLSAKSGQEVHKALLSDRGATNELISNLKKYGLNEQDVRRWLTRARLAQVVATKPRMWAAAVAGGYLAEMIGARWGGGALVGGFSLPFVLDAALRRSNHPFVAEGYKLLLKRSYPGPMTPSTPVTPSTAPAAAAAPKPAPTPYTPSPEALLQAKVPLQLQPALSEQPFMDAMLSILQEADEKDRPALAAKLKKEMEQSFERQRSKARTAEAMKKYKQ